MLPTTMPFQTLKICLFVVFFLSSFCPGFSSDDEDEQVGRKFQAEVGQTVTLTCSTACKSCRVLWFREGDAGETKRLPDNCREKNKNLVVHHVTPENYGFYVCVSRNSKKILKERVELAPPFGLSISTGNHLVYGDGDCLKVKCELNGDPHITLEWLKDMKPITDSSVTVQEDDKGLELIISFAQEKHQGYYTCRGKKGEETITANITLEYDYFAKNTADASFC